MTLYVVQVEKCKGFWWRSTCCPVAVPTLPSQRVGGTPRYANASLPRLKGTNKEWVRICCDFLVRGRNKRKRIWFWFYRRRGKPLEKRWGSRSDRKPRRGCLASPPLFFGVNEDVGVNVLFVDDFPRLFTWIQKLKEHPTVKTNFPSHQEFDYYKQNRETIGPSKIEWIMARTDICMI